jgi:glucuronoarabinoxylan endo-1,4-beta-xylanase
MKKCIFLILIISLLNICWAEFLFSQNPVKIDFGTHQQQIDGFGASTAWHGRISDKEADIAFGNGANQLGLSILRVRIDPWGVNNWKEEMDNSKKAEVRGAIIFASPWTPPSAMKTNNNTVGGSLKPTEYGNYATYLNQFIDYMYENDVTISAISLQNEPNMKVDYESCDWSPTLLHNFCKDYSSAIRADVVVPEAFNFDFAYSDPILNDSVAASHIAIIGGHIYGSIPRKYDNALNKGKKVWMTEHYYIPDDRTTCITMAKEILDCMNCNMSAYIWWYLRQPECNLITSEGEILEKGYIMAHFSKFIRPGYYKVKATWNPQSGIYVCAFTGEKSVIVVLNNKTVSISQQFEFQNNTTSKLIKYTTSNTKTLSNDGTIDVSGGSFSTELDPQSLTTFVSSEKLTSDRLNNNNGIDFQFFPNPSESGNFSLTVDQKGNNLPMNMQIIDLSGRLVYEQSIANRENEIKANLNPGIYFLKVIDGNSILSKKLIVK